MSWNWDPHYWKKSTKIFLALATIWPPIYICLFMLAIFSMMLVLPFTEKRSTRCGDIDLLQLDQKIKNGEIKQLTVRPTQIVARDRRGNCEFEVFVSNESTREMIVNDAREIVAGHPRVELIAEENSQPPVSPLFPIGMVTLAGAHILTMLLIMALMPLYIVLVVKSDRLDQTARIIWVVLICMLGMFAMPIYWYLYIWRDAPPASSVTTSS